VIAYGNGTAGFQVSPSGAIAFDATPLVADGVVSLQNGDFGDAGQYLVSQGDTLPPLWTSPSTPSLAEVLDVSPAGVANADQTITLSTSTDTNVVSGEGVAISTATESSTLTKDTLTISNGSLATTLREVSLSTTGDNGFIYVKNQDSFGTIQTAITPFQVKIQNNTIQDNYVAIEPTQIGIGVAGVVDYGDAGQVLTSGGSLGGLSWTTSSGTPTLNDVLTEGNSSNQSILLQDNETEDDYKLELSSTTGIINTYYNPTGVVLRQTEIITNGVFINEGDVDTIGSRYEGRPYSINLRNNNTTTGIDKSIVIETSTASSTPYVSLYNTQTGINKQSSLSTTSLQFIDDTTTTTYDDSGIISQKASFDIQNDTLINIGTSDNGANTITIGHTSATTANYSPVNINGKLNINDVLFSGGDGSSTQLSVGSYTIPQNALRNSSYTLIMSGTANPTTLNFPTDDTGGKYITVFNAGTNPILCSCSASPTRPFIGGGNGLSGGTTYPIRSNQTVQFLSAGSSGFILFSQSNSNTNINQYPSTVQTLTTNQRILATRITGAAVNGTFTYTSISGQFAFASPASVQLTAEDATGTQTMILRTNTTTGFTYVSSSGVFPTTLHIYAVGT
jgi:hypothetical protein